MSELNGKLVVKLVVEFICTFIFLFVIFYIGKAFEIGVVLIATVLVAGPISGGHLNPAVTIANWWKGKMSGFDSTLYVIVQVLAGICAFWFATSKWIPEKVADFCSIRRSIPKDAALSVGASV